jgi:RNA polymerase sigma-70 factor (ECF subfamily)
VQSWSEKDLINGCIKESKSFQKELYRRYAGKMLVVCMRYARHRMEAEDILQEAFIKIFDNISRFQFKGSFEGWIRRIIVNTAIKNYRRMSFKRELIGNEDHDTEFTQPDAVENMSEEELLNLIETLPDGYRIVFNLYAIEGFSHKEISEMLNIQEGTSRSQLVKARKMLQQKINLMKKELACQKK